MAPATQPKKTGIEEDGPAIELIKHDNGQEKQEGIRGRGLMSSNLAKTRALITGWRRPPHLITHKVSKLNLKGSYRKAKDKLKRSLFGIPKEETGIGGERE